MAFQNLPPPPPTKNADSALDRWLQLMSDKISAAGAIVWTQITLPTKAANTFLGGPASGADAQVDFRALVNDDLPVVGISKGGTGQSTQTAAFDALAPTTTQGDLIYHNGTDNIRLAKGTAAQRLTMNAGATAPEWQTDTGTGTVTSIDVSGGTTGLTFSGGPITTSGTITMAGTLDADNGGTGQSSYAVGDLLYASTTTALSKLADVSAGSYLRSGGVNTAPLWSTLKLPNAATANYIPYATSTNTWGESANLTFDGSALTLTGTQVISANSATTALRVTQVGAGDVVRFEDSANPDATPFIIDALGKVLVAVGATSLTTNGSIQAAVQGSTISGITTNSGSASERAHWRLAVSDAEVAAIGTTSGSFYISTAGTKRVNISSAGVTTITSDGAGAVMSLVSTNMEGATTNIGSQATLTFGDTATVRGIGYQTTLSTEAAAFTLGEMSHFKAIQGTIGAGSTNTNQYGFRVDSTLTGATNNHGFSSVLVAATGRWNLFMGGTAQNYMAGNLGIGITVPAQLLDVAATNTGLTNDLPLNIIRLTDTDTTTAANQPLGKVEFYGSDATVAEGVRSYLLSASKGTSGGGDLRFGVSANGGSVAEFMRLTSVGLRVGAASDPTVPLDVTGAALISSTLGVTGVSSFAAGAVGAPGIYLAADTTSGLYRIGANNIGVAISGAKVLDIASTGMGVTGALSSTTLGVTGLATLSQDRGIRFDNQTSAAAANAGTLGNAPTAGDPGYWLKINVDGTNYSVPCWAG